MLKEFCPRLHVRAGRRQRESLAVPNGDHEVGSEEDIDLAGLDGILSIDVPQGLDGQEQRVLIELELGSLMGGDRVLHRQRVESEGVGDALEFLLAGFVQADPDEVAGSELPTRQGQRRLIVAKFHPLPVPVARAVDDHTRERSRGGTRQRIASRPWQR